jgi:BirA family biotin operon repressor/biotin-[acetyl-CoA-carboxylase] ligase
MNTRDVNQTAPPDPNVESRTPETLSLIGCFDSIPSTNTLCAEVVRLYEDRPESLPTGLIFADSQTAGKGRGDHGWISPPGGLYFSVFFRVEPIPVFLPLTTGLFLSRWVEEVAGLSVKVRWPNDLMLEGRKLGGILCETKNGACIIGVGLNVNATGILEGGSLQPPAVLSEMMGCTLDLKDMRRRVRDFMAGDFLPFILDSKRLAEWDERSALSPGQAVTWKAGGRSFRGVYLGITVEGYLKVRIRDAVHELAAAEEVRGV